MNTAAPAGFRFDFEEVKTERGTKSLGQVPILVCEDVEAALEKYGAQGVVNVLDGTSLRVSFQGIARRMKAAGKTDDEIAEAQLKFVPGNRQVGESTPASRSKRIAGEAAGKLSDPSILEAFLAKVKSGEIDEATLGGLAK